MDSTGASADNIGSLENINGSYRILITDTSGRCPNEYKESNAAAATDFQVEGWVEADNGTLTFDEGNPENDYYRKVM